MKRPRTGATTLRIALPLLAALTLSAAHAGTSPDERVVVQSSVFLRAHPDIHHRLRALDRLERGELDAAIADLREAARHADKPSQAILAEMHWLGRGVPMDRARAYAWMDLAAERGYPLMVAKREAYWRDLTEAERSTAIAEGEVMLAEYGDAAARPRLEAMLKRARIDFRRGRAHTVGAKRVNLLVGDRFYAVEARLFDDRKFWTPEGYFAWQDELGHAEGRGRVDVGEVEPTAAD